MDRCNIGDDPVTSQARNPKDRRTREYDRCPGPESSFCGECWSTRMGKTMLEMIPITLLSDLSESRSYLYAG